MTRSKLFENDRIVEAVVDLAAEIEKHVINGYSTELRAAIRENILSELRGKLFADAVENSEPLPESDPQPKPQQTDMHGEPVAGDSATPLPVYGRRHPKGDPDFWKNYDRPLSKSHQQLVEILRRGFVAVPTLAGMTGLKSSTVHQYLQDLKRNGFQIEKKNANRRFGRRGYNKIYRLAS